jgi:hypothetical protein
MPTQIIQTSGDWLSEYFCKYISYIQAVLPIWYFFKKDLSNWTRFFVMRVFPTLDCGSLDSLVSPPHRSVQNYGINLVVNESFIFYPPRRRGTIFHAGAIATLLLLAIFGLYRAAYSNVGPNFLLYLLPVILAIPAVPYLLYRWNALRNSVYTLERDRIHLQWGLRTEVIPTNNVLWVRPASDLLENLRLPWFRWPGSIIGERRFSKEFVVEFLASQSRDLILVGTYDRVFAISPEDPGEFLQAYQRMTELGSLIPPQPQSVRATFLLARVWQTRPAGLLILLGFVLSLGLLIWVSLLVPARPKISLGFTAGGFPRDPIDGVRLMLLPILNTIFFVINFFTGVFLFRRDEQRPLAYLLWGSTIFVTGLFLAAVYFIQKTG